jgi:hypothetical protein
VTETNANSEHISPLSIRNKYINIFTPKYDPIEYYSSTLFSVFQVSALKEDQLPKLNMHLLTPGHTARLFQRNSFYQMSRLSHFLYNWPTDGDGVVSLTPPPAALYPKWMILDIRFC